MKNKVALVSIVERDVANSYEFTSKVFANIAKAEQWVESQITKLIKQYKLDPDISVDGWFVQLAGWAHTVQFDIVETTIY